MQDVVAVIADIVKQFIVRRLAQFIKRQEVRRHESATRAATNERLDPPESVCIWTQEDGVSYKKGGTIQGLQLRTKYHNSSELK